MKTPHGFKCRRCGDCCYSPRISKKEIKKIENKLRQTEKEFVNDLGEGFKYIKTKHSKCMFLKRGKIAKCVIHPLRPEVCRLYPSELGKRGSCKPKRIYFDYYRTSIQNEKA